VFAELREAKATVVGVSMDTLESHRAFAKAHGLTFPLLADTDGALAAKYGVGPRRGFAGRVTLIIKDGKIAKVYPRVVVRGHADEVLSACKSL
jgi:peroxiredoxin Q/BCP